MRVPQANLFGLVHVNKIGTASKKAYNTMPTKNDEVAFTSTAYYLKKYVTLPDDIKKDLPAADAVDMFKDIELVVNRQNSPDERGIRSYSIYKSEGNAKLIGEGPYSRVYKSPWLEDYYFLILDNGSNYSKQTVYSHSQLGDSVWCDKDDARVQIIKKCA